jgi:hypothetical protein
MSEPHVRTTLAGTMSRQVMVHVEDGASRSGRPLDDRQAQGNPESYTWPLVALVVIILPQLLVPPHDRLGPPLLVPIMEGIALLALLIIAAKPGPVPRGAHSLVLALVGLLLVANAIAAVRLVTIVLDNAKIGSSQLTASRLLMAAGLLLLANVVTFGLLYWQVDGGGPSGRTAEPAPFPDFQFPQTATEGLAPPGWRPHFGDYLYVAFTNIVAFSPTDTLPLTLRVKGPMALQSMISLAVLVVVLSRVINILPT